MQSRISNWILTHYVRISEFTMFDNSYTKSISNENKREEKVCLHKMTTVNRTKSDNFSLQTDDYFSRSVIRMANDSKAYIKRSKVEQIRSYCYYFQFIGIQM